MVSHNEKAKMNHEPWEVVITDCDHGFVTLEQEEMDRIGARMTLAQVKNRGRRHSGVRTSRWASEPVCTADQSSP